MIELILGGARSGKSRFAEQRAQQSGKKKIYIATAQVLDDEMSERVKAHQQRRTADWQTIEEPKALATTLQQVTDKEHCVLVDCLTLWLSNLLQLDDVNDWQHERAALLETLPTLPGHIILVSNEIGSGIVPMGELTRRFVDESGWLHQDIAQISDRVSLVIAGLVQTLKDDSVN